MTSAKVNGITFEYESYGDESNPTLLLVMGLGGQLVSWPMDWVQRWVERGLRVVRYDNRDIGLSEQFTQTVTRRRLVAAAVSKRWAHAEYTVDDMGDDAAGLLDHLGVERAHVVGVSMGGMISQALAIRHPGKVASLTSIMSNTGDRAHGRPAAAVLAVLGRRSGGSRTPAETIDATVELFRLISGPHFDADEVRSLAEAALARHVDAEGTFRQLLGILASNDRTAALRQLDTPTLVIHGLVDRLVAPSGGIATAKAIPGSRLLMFPDMGHDLPRPRWDEMIEAIVANLRRGGYAG